MGVDQQGNAVLGALLSELAWSPRLLAEAVNGVLGPGYVARGTVSDWVHRDRLPRDPLPTVVAHVISDTLDREVCFDELWSGRAQLAELWVPADDGMNLPWTPAGTVGVLDDWLGHTGGAIRMDRRFVLAVSGGALTAPAWAYADQLATRGGSFAGLADTGLTPWFGPDMLERQLAQGALTLASVTSRESHRLLDGAEATLGRTGTDAAMASHAVFHAGWLARAHIAAGDLDRAVPAGLTALRRLPTVRSRRCALLLHRLETDLAALPSTHRPASIRSLHDQLRATHAA